jgi:hypothetical protein
LAEIDRQKEVVGFFKSAFFVVLGLIVALSGYIFEKYEKLPDIKLLILNVTEIVLLIAFVLIGLKLKKEIDKLKDL